MAMAMTAVGAQGGGSFQGSDEWIRETLRRHEAKRRAREAARGAKPTVPFDRVVFTQHVQEILKGDVNDGFVIGLKRRREFAMQLCDDYKRFNDAQKLELVLALAVDLGVQDLSLMVKTLPSVKRSGLVLSVVSAALGFSRKNDPNTSKNIKRGLVPLAEQLFLLIGTIPPGPKFLLNLRVDLNYLVGKHRATLPADNVEALEFLDMVMRDLFATQAGMRFLRIDLSSEKLVAFVLKNERVHAIRGWEDLHRRIAGPQRFCFGLFHTHMSSAPLVFVQVLATDHLSNKIAPILNHDTPVVANPTHIIFYSVSSSNNGLRGLNIASHLLFLTIQRMTNLFPMCHTSATLSPVPGFEEWLRAVLSTADAQLQQPGVKQRLAPIQRSFFSPEQAQQISIKYGVNQLVLHKWLLKRLQDPAWCKDEELVNSIRDVMTAACARYVLFERKGEKIWDPVANFHLQNGAQVEQINFLADTSDEAIDNALGTMINYRYCMTSVDVTSVSYKRKSLAAVSSSVARLIWPSTNLILEELERVKLERNIPLFAQVYRAGEVISARGTLPTAIYFIISGRVRVASAHPYVLHEGHVFGDREVLLEEPIPYNIRAETPTHLVLLPFKDAKVLKELSSAVRSHTGTDPRVLMQQQHAARHASKL